MGRDFTKGVERATNALSRMAASLFEGNGNVAGIDEDANTNLLCRSSGSTSFEASPTALSCQEGA